MTLLGSPGSDRERPRVGASVEAIASDADVSLSPAREHDRLGDRYVLTRAVATGGMATVWEAHDDVLGRRVAVKVLHPHLAADPVFLGRFRSEARAAARLSQASIVGIYDTVSEPGAEAIVMELVEGIDLRQYLDQVGVMPLGAAVDLVVAVAGALEAAHDAQIVHRDIKPANILLCADRRVKVTDFGIAKALEEEDHTTQGALLGTAKYLAPEQVAGDAIDRRTDIYALGTVLYEALVGTVPFDEGTAAATALARLHRDPTPPSSRRPELPPAVDQVILRALAREPADRYPSASAFAEAIIAAVSAPVPAVMPPVDPTAPLDLASAPAAPDSAPPAQPVPAVATPPTPQVDVPRAAPDRDHLLGIIVGLVVLGSLVLGVGLLLTSSAGRDLVERIREDLTGSGDATDDGTDEGTGDGADAGDASAPQVGPAPAVAGVDRPAGNTPDDGFEIVDYDPEGDGSEHADRASLAADGDETTFWHSERYDNRQLGNLKRGVGLVLELPGDRALNELRVVSPSSGWTARVYVADSPAARLEGWGEPIDGRADISGATTFDLRGRVGSAVLLWVTDLGDELPRPRIEIAELALE